MKKIAFVVSSFALITAVEAKTCMVKPVDNPIVTSRFGKVRSAADVKKPGYGTSVHQGLDFGGGQKIYSTAKVVPQQLPQTPKKKPKPINLTRQH